MRASTHQPSFRVFLSSPGDVKAEREAAERVVRRISVIYAAHVDIVLERWEGKFYQATAGFQEQIEVTSAFDLVVGILWKRIGTELLPDLFRRPDGTAFESGTVLELEAALEASAARGGKPAIFVFRKNAEILFSKVNLADEKVQNDLLDVWWNRTFRDAEGRFRRASEGFMTTQEFETRFEDLLMDQLLGKRLIPDGAVWDIEDKGSPYPGLEPYGKERRSVLFGRSLAIRDACDELINASRLKGGLPALFVVGPSGSGKSSLVRGGIAPELTDPGVVAEVDCWRTIAVEGDAGLLGALATQLYRDDGLPELAGSPRKVPASWAQLSAEAPAAAADDIVWVLDRIASAEQLRTGADRTLQARLLLVVDQLERMFGTDDAAKVSALLRALVATGRVWLIATLRSDRYAALQTDRDLLELRRHGTVYDLPPPGQAEISDIVKGPARAAGLAFQDGERDGKPLVRMLIENTPSADALPLLQMTLRELFDARDGMTLTWRAYEAMGGASGAIATHAGAVLADLLPAVRSELPDLVSKLTRDVSREASGRIRFTATAADARWAATPARQALVSRMVEERLLVEDEPEPDRKLLRVAHEALLRQWRPASSVLEAIADRALRRARLLQFGAFASAVVFLLVAAGAGWFYWKAKVAESAALSLLEEAARSDRLVAEEKLQGGKDADALAYLARASRYVPKSSLPAEIALSDMLSPPIVHSLAIFQGHTNYISSAVFSPDGRRVLTASADNTARLWEAESGKLLAIFQGHTNQVRSAVFSPGGLRVLTASSDNTARLWDAATGSPIGEPMQHEGPVDSAQFSPDGRRVLTASEDNTARLWEAESGQLLATFQGYSEVFSPDGRRVLTLSVGNTARLWEAESGQLLAIFQGHTNYISSAVFSPDGRRVLTASADNTARLWEAESGKLLAIFQGHTNQVRSAVFSPGGLRVLTASSDNTARLWDAATGSPIGEPMQHEGPVDSAQFSPDGRRVLTASEDNTARLWEAESGQLLATFQGYSEVFSPDGRRVLTLSVGNTARLWEAESGQLLATFQGHTGPVTSAVFSPDGRRVLTGSADKTARLWEAESGKLLATFQGHAEIVHSAVFSPDGRRVLTASRDKTARLWEAESGKLLATFKGHTGPVTSAVFSPDGRRVLTASDDKTARLWEAESGKLLATFQGHTDEVRSAVFSPDGRRVLTGSADTARLWDAESGKLLATFEGHTYAVFSPDGRRVLTASDDGTARLWPILPAGASPPDWCGDFLVWLGGKRIGPDGQIETLSGQELQDLDARLRPHMNEDTDYARLLRWRLLAPEQRPVDPYGILTQAEAADLIIQPDMNSAEARHAYDLDPWHPLVHLALAGFEEDPIRADFLRRCSLDRLPNDPKFRQRAAELLRRQGKEDLAQELEVRGQ